MSDSLHPHGLLPARLLCPRDFPGKNTGVGCHFLLQGLFLTWESNPYLLGFLHWQADSLLLNHQGSLLPLSHQAGPQSTIPQTRSSSLPFFCKQGFVEIHNTMAELNSCDRDSMAHRAEKIYSLTFDRKNHPSFARQSPAFSP